MANPPAKTPDDLFAALDALGIEHSTVKHPPLFTVEQSRQLRGQIPGGHTKNLFLRDKKGALFLVVALENAVIDLKGLHRFLGASGRFSFGSADLLREVWGVAPGSVTPFWRHQRRRAPGHRRARRADDGAGAPQLPPAGQHHDDGDRSRRSRPVPGLDRSSASYRTGLRIAAGGGLNPIAFAARMTHLSRTEPGYLARTNVR
jgi:prolyl-tRNA editing enzyme YbaK/EbsC (Cys-tRNA(Pro) deacylase)